LSRGRPAAPPLPNGHKDPDRDKSITLPKGAFGVGELLKTFLLLPAIFAASAAFMWSRPVEQGDGGGDVDTVSVDARFHSISSELVDRFTTQPTGAVIPRQAVNGVVQNRVAHGVQTQSNTPPSQSATQNLAEKDAITKQVFRILQRHGKPIQNGKALASAIVKEAISQEYDPLFVAAVIKSESAFNSLAQSNKGAQGLMQIMPKTGAWLAEQAAIPRGKLTDPGHNLKLGISYLKQLEAEYKGNRVLTLVAYNWGPGHVESASSGSRRVPGEVMQYAVKILNDYRRWTSELRSGLG